MPPVFRDQGQAVSAFATHADLPMCAGDVRRPRLAPVFRGQGQAVGAFATHTDDISGCGEPGVLNKIRHFLVKRFGSMELQEDSLVHVGMEVMQNSNFSATATQGDFAKNLQPLGPPPQLWAARQKLRSPEDVRLRQFKLGDLLVSDRSSTGY